MKRPKVQLEEVFPSELPKVNKPVFEYLIWWLKNEYPKQPDGFHMQEFECAIDGVCGTVRCLSGWLYHLYEIPMDSINDYDQELYGTSFKEESELPHWEWCFGADWSLTDNTIEGGIKRIEIILEDKIPENWYEQMTGEAPVEYLN